MATRPDTSQAFDDIRAVEELNTTYSQRPTWISPDLCRLYLSREVDEGEPPIMIEAIREPTR